MMTHTYKEEPNGTLDLIKNVDYCMQQLGASLNLADPQGGFSSENERNNLDETTKKAWLAVLKDYRDLSDAIHALRADIESWVK